MKKTLFLYILSEIIPTFFVGLTVFLFVILMTQFLQISEFVLIRDISFFLILKILGNMMISLLPIVLPTSLLFSILLTYSRLNVDSELVAFRALGHSYMSLAFPAVVFSAVISLISAQVLIFVAPVARFDYDKMMSQVGGQQIMSAITKGTFSDNFFGLMLYANDVDNKNHTMQDLFIYDKRSSDNPLIIVSKQGKVFSDSSLETQSASITLTDGYIIGQKKTSNAVIKFDTYEVKILNPVQASNAQRELNTIPNEELSKKLEDPTLTDDKRREFLAEYHRRIGTAASCLIFGFLGTALGFGINRRSSASSGFLISIICVSLYWLCYAIIMSWVIKTTLPAALVMWIPNMIFAGFTFYKWKKLW